MRRFLFSCSIFFCSSIACLFCSLASNRIISAYCIKFMSLISCSLYPCFISASKRLSTQSPKETPERSSTDGPGVLFFIPPLFRRRRVLRFFLRCLLCLRCLADRCKLRLHFQRGKCKSHTKTELRPGYPSCP